MAKSAKKKEAICRVATRLFVEKGFEKTSIRDIAEAGNMNSSGLYYYFEDKADLYGAVMDDVLDRIGRRVRAVSRGDLPVACEAAQPILREADSRTGGQSFLTSSIPTSVSGISVWP